jgi:hypothetical protein
MVLHSRNYVYTFCTNRNYCNNSWMSRVKTVPHMVPDDWGGGIFLARAAELRSACPGPRPGPTLFKPTYI